MELILASLFLGLLCVVLLLNLFSLPANWVMLILVFAWRFLHPAGDTLTISFFFGLVGLALVGELVEFIAQGWGSKRYGSTTGGMWGGLLGAFVGAFLGLTFLFGFGALIGALAGAWLGCYLVEFSRGRDSVEAARAAKGALVGRFLGIVVKCSIGVIMLGMVYDAIWPGVLPSLQLPLPQPVPQPVPTPPSVTL